MPFYFNFANVPVTIPVFFAIRDQISDKYNVEFIFVDDGSRDGTYSALEAVQAQNPDFVTTVKLSRNFGSTNAVFAGIEYSKGDVHIFTASDLQTPPSMILEMLDYWEKGIKVVYAHRTGRDESFFVRVTARIYHWLISIALPGSPKGGFDSFLLDRKVTEDVSRNRSANEYLPSLIMWLGYPSVGIPYVRLKRTIGKSRWNFSKKMGAFFDSFLGYSYLPIRAIAIVGVIFGILGIAYLLLIIVSYINGDIDERGWASLMSVVLIAASVNFIFLSILGEYVWRILTSVQARANFIVETSSRRVSSNG